MYKLSRDYGRDTYMWIYNRRAKKKNKKVVDRRKKKIERVNGKKTE